MGDHTFEYFLKHELFGEIKVSKEKYRKVQVDSGFHSDTYPDLAGFGTRFITGSIRPSLKGLTHVKLDASKISLRDEMVSKGKL